LHAHPPLCDHLQPNGWPFEVELVIDEQMGFTDALVTCRTCGAPYLLEMLDWRGRQRLMRVSTVESSRVTPLLHNLGRGSCDLRRAAAEVRQLQAGADLQPLAVAAGRDRDADRGDRAGADVGTPADGGLARTVVRRAVGGLCGARRRQHARLIDRFSRRWSIAIGDRSYSQASRSEIAPTLR
jgi:hypothetical protein